MAAVTSLGSQTFTTDVTAYTTTSGFTPGAIGDLLVVWVGTSDTPAATTSTLTETAGGGTYTRIGQGLRGASADLIICYVRDTLTENTTLRNYVFTTVASDAGTGCSFQVCRVTGMSLAGAAAVRQSDAHDNIASSGTPATVFAGVTLTTNPCIGAVINGTNPTTMTPPASFNELVDIGRATPSRGLEVVNRDSGHTSATITWGSTTPTAGGAFAIELDATPAATFIPDVVMAV